MDTIYFQILLLVNLGLAAKKTNPLGFIRRDNCSGSKQKSFVLYLRFMRQCFYCAKNTMFVSKRNRTITSLTKGTMRSVNKHYFFPIKTIPSYIDAKNHMCGIYSFYDSIFWWDRGFIINFCFPFYTQRNNPFPLEHPPPSPNLKPWLNFTPPHLNFLL